MSEPSYAQRTAGRVASKAIRVGASFIRDQISKSGSVSTLEVNNVVDAFIKENDCVPSLAGYKPSFHDGEAYQHATCISVDNEAVHGVPAENKFIVADSMVTIDLVVSFEGMHVDTARTFMVNNSSQDAKSAFWVESKMAFSVIRQSLFSGMTLEQVGQIAETAIAESPIFVMSEFAGHGIGEEIHERPTIPLSKNQEQERLVPGKSYAIEPVFASKKDYSLYLSQQDGWTYYANCFTSHFEDTIFIRDDGKIINLTG